MNFIQRYGATFTALVLLAPTYYLARPLVPSENEEEQLAKDFKFHQSEITSLTGTAGKTVRKVHPSLERISAWISSLGAAVTLADLDGDGLPNDIVLVDPRSDLVTVSTAPGTGSRFEAFTLDPSPLPYDSQTMAPMGTVAGDFNEDGLTDLLVYFWGRTPVLYLRQAGNDEKFSKRAFVPAELTHSGERWFSNGAIQADFDGDGHTDLIIGNYFQDGAHILDSHGGGTEVLHEGKARALNGGLKHFFLWQSSGSGENSAPLYKEVTGILDEAVNRGWTLAIGAGDLDGDLLPEIYFAFDFGPDRLLHNRSTKGTLKFAVLSGHRDFFTPKSCVMNNDSFKGMGCDFGDLNGDGIPDIYVSNIATRYGLTESHFLWQSTGNISSMKDGIAPYVQASEKLGLARSGWGWDCKLADFNNDGIPEAIQATGFIKGTINRWPELQALGTSNDQVVHNPKFWPTFKPGADLSGQDLDPFFVRGTDGRYHDIGPRIGLDKPMVSRGIAIADVDGDGRLDFALANQWGPSYFFHNEATESGAFLGLHVLLPINPSENEVLRVRTGHPHPHEIAARPAIGAVATVRLPDGKRLVSQVDGGNGHSGRRSPELHFGLGTLIAGERVSVELKWRDQRGNPRRGTIALEPGWHTVWLGELPLRKMAAKGQQ